MSVNKQMNSSVLLLGALESWKSQAEPSVHDNYRAPASQRSSLDSRNTLTEVHVGWLIRVHSVGILSNNVSSHSQ